MDTVNLQVEGLDKGSLRPERSPEDKLVSSYLEDHSEIYRDLVKVQDDVSEPRLLQNWQSFVDFSGRYGTTLKLLLTSKSNVARQMSRKQRKAKASSA